ncbi:MAG: hypothetical protein ACR2JC_12185 [Chloroflexota bacterium]|nr:MAG: hypothetical protein DLM70_07350 [Chloroflexota bacterium]
MRRWLAGLILLIPVILNAPVSHASGGAAYSPAIRGSVAGYRLAGIEPDGDPLDQVALNTRLSGSARVPSLRLIVNSYLENFKPDTTPILPDLLHPNRTAHNLGGFLQGKVLLTDGAGNVLYIGSFIAEAFLDNSNRAVMSMDGIGAASGGGARLKGTFYLRKGGSLDGRFTGHISIPRAALRQIAAQRGARMKKLQDIMNTVIVKPAAMVGRSTARSQTVPLKTNYGAGATHSPASTGSSRRLSPITVIAGAGAIVSLLIGLYLFWSERRQTKRA